MPEKLTYKQTLKMRRNHVGKSCKLHFEVAPLKIVRGSKQYMYDDLGNEFLDCITNVSHVGHCHPHVVSCGQEQMAQLASSSGFLSEALSMYAKRLVETLPEELCVCYFLNSGSEANDLALRLAQAYTGNEDIVVVDNAYHGNLASLINISPQKFKKLPNGKKDYVHVVPSPDIYRGVFRDTPNAGQLYSNEAKRVMQNAIDSGRQIAAFVSEPLMSLCGVIIPPDNYLQSVYRHVRELGGVCIADEVQVGLGRVGEHYWSFQAHDVVPDIMTCGKPLGNGHPMAVVVTRKEIAESLPDFSSSFGGNPVSCAIGLAVLDVIRNEQLMSSAKVVGMTLLNSYKAIQPRHPMMGDVRGVGLVIGVEIVTDKESRKPAKEAAELLAYKMKERKILIANEGPDKNIMLMLPPMCFTVDNARHVVQAFDQCLAEIEVGVTPESFHSTNGPEHVATTQLTIPLQVVSGGSNLDDSDEEDPNEKRARFEDID